MPRYKVRSEGDYVRMGDQIILESVKTPGQFIHVSKKLESLGDDYSAETKVLCSYPEVDLSVLRDAFTVRPHILSAKKSEASFLRVQSDTFIVLSLFFFFFLTILIGRRHDRTLAQRARLVRRSRGQLCRCRRARRVHR